MRDTRTKISILAGLIALTVAIHYGWVLENMFGHHPWVHSVHGRFCYVPILIGAAWFGVRGGLISAASISILILPYLSGHTGHMGGDISDEIVEVLFYFGIGALVGTLVDRENLTIRKQEKTQRELERSQHLSLVGQMAASVAHEIKNPLASIKGATEIIVDDRTSPAEKKEFQGILSSEIKRIDSTVKEFLQFARPRETMLSPLNFSQALQASLKQIAPQVAVQGINISESIEPDIQILGDQEKLHQVVINLALNAAQSSVSGTTIGVLLRKATTVQAELLIRDQGKGIEPKNLERIFEPFYTTRSSGTGLGLAIVKSIVDDHKGKISLSSTVGQGTQVQIILPLLRNK
jgi:two-component system, NtrC family, sensor histidine kinase HydH